MTQKDKFIDKYYEQIKDHYREEGKELGYAEEQLDDYVLDTINFTFVGTQEEVNDELQNKPYYVIVQEGNYMAVETFGGTTYDI